MHILRHNWYWKLLCLVGAVALLVYVRKQEDLVRRTLYLPLVFAVPAGQRMVEPALGTTVRVDLEGPAQLIRTIANEEVRLMFDPSGVAPGTRKDVEVAVELPEKYRDAVTVDWRPSVVPVRIVSDTSRPYSVVVKQLKPPDDWEFRDGPSPSPGRVLVSGTQDVVSRVESILAPLTVPPTDRVYDPEVRLRALDKDGRDLTAQVQIEPPLVTVTGVQQRVVLQKRVPVQPIYQAPPGWRVTRVEVAPRFVRVMGKERVVGPIYGLETEPIELAPGEHEVVRDVGLILADQSVKLTPDRVRVTLRMQAAGAPAPAPTAPPDTKR